MGEQKDRMGSSFERLVADVFTKIGFKTKKNVSINKENGQRSEQDVLAEKGNLKILVQCKDYAKFPDVEMEETIQDLIEDGKSIGANKLVLAIIGLKNYGRWKDYAKNKGVYLWDEDYWRKLQNIETHQELKQEIGKNLQLPEVFVSEKKMFQLIDSSKMSEKDKERMKKQASAFKDLDELEEEVKSIEIREEIKSNLETTELEEIEEIIKYYNFDYHYKYLIYEKIKKEVDLSEDPKRILNFQSIRTYADYLADKLYGKDEGSKKLIEIYEGWRSGKISKKDRDKIAEKIYNRLGVHIEIEIGTDVTEIGEDIKAAILKKKLIKIAIALGLIGMAFIILWRILF